ncbi:hypothetical protein HD806DRAFT_351098 [Xylariaceae sp. AK1471]|nr:hypothetical protein HD806DRAFT_351098 [Xylariaceae sp. AK1471]
MCKKVYMSKWCLGHGPTNDWELTSTHECECGLATEIIYRQPHPYFTYRCDDCVANDRWFESSVAGIEWRKEHKELEREQEEMTKAVRHKLKKKKAFDGSLTERLFLPSLAM